MKNLLLFSLISLICFSACQTEHQEKATREYEEFKVWFSDRADKVDSASRQEWAEFKDEWNEKTAVVESKVETLTETEKKDYEEKKSRYTQMESDNAARWEAEEEKVAVTIPQEDTITIDPQKVKVLEKQLLGKEMGDWSSVTAANVKQLYVTFLENVRKHKDKWSREEWAHVEHIWDKLDLRKEKVEDNLDVTDKAKIAALKAEYEGLYTVARVED